MTTRPGHISQPSSLRVHIRGRVQGVGFRPFIYRMAVGYGLRGEVYNQTDGVIVHIEGESSSCSRFIEGLKKKAPPAAVIKDVSIMPMDYHHFKDFRINSSRPEEHTITEISPDIAVCNDCIQELTGRGRRKGYPFINCINCGPRFTILENLPYDRVHTTMREFTVCPECSSEYADPDTRFFHAQPVSCPACGPTYRLYEGDNHTDDFSSILNRVCSHIDKGLVVAIKSLGGYNLACDAHNEKAVEELRRLKKRDRKPFAVLFRSLADLRKIIAVSPDEEETLLSWRRPIVILEGKGKTPLAEGITKGLHSLGAFLPYLPVHYLMFSLLKTDAMVMTSGNASDTPILIDDLSAREAFREVSGGIITNNRTIARRADDSVVKVICGEPSVMRRSRGYTPAPVDLGFNADSILAVGAELSNAFCLGKMNQAIFSQHIGDLQNRETYDFFTENIAKFSVIFRFRTKKIACDLHPDYFSTRYAEKMGLPLVKVQHHHAHITSVMALHRLSGKVIGLAYDGTGLGTDGKIWGSEALIASYSDFERISHFGYIPLPGGDSVTREPWRTALSYLYRAFGTRWKENLTPLLKKIDLSRAEKLITAIDKNINSPLSCSAGRLFDAVAAILGICFESSYHAEAPQLLENYICPEEQDLYSFTGSSEVSFIPVIRQIVRDLNQGTPHPKIVTRFHNTVAYAGLCQVRYAAEKTSTDQVVLSGGSFQNKYLTEKLVYLLKQHHFNVFLAGEIPCNDGGIALGQLAVAAHEKP